ncbi:MAG: hypothetical protein ABWY06_16130 [Pseudomonas sp.]|uniref:hypothetical protein n=1 Tax=Pseudomonas sp. TaxID=306 RepID=UPI0033932AF0
MFSSAVRSILALALLGSPLGWAASGPQKPLQVERIGAIQLADQARQDPSAEQACRAWGLSVQQANGFFALSEIQDSRALHDSFDWMPCHLEGSLRDANGQTWRFEINPAATASTWQPGGDRFFWGCWQAACEPLVLMMPTPPGAEY